VLLSPQFSLGTEGISLMEMLKTLNKGGELLRENFLILGGSSECLLEFSSTCVAIDLGGTTIVCRI